MYYTRSQNQNSVKSQVFGTWSQRETFIKKFGVSFIHMSEFGMLGLFFG